LKEFDEQALKKKNLLWEEMGVVMHGLFYQNIQFVEVLVKSSEPQELKTSIFDKNRKITARGTITSTP
jgi:hypothetical protein